MKNLLRNAINEQEAGEVYVDQLGKLYDKRLRRIFTLMKSIPDIDKWNKTLGNEHYMYPNRGSWVQEMRTILKLFGVDVMKWGTEGGGIMPPGTTFDRRASVKTFYETFLQNGGSSRDFDSGELDLRPIFVYRINADATVEIVEETNISAEVWGAQSEEEALEKLRQEPDRWASIEDSITSEYGPVSNIRDLEVYDRIEYRITEKMIGLSDPNEMSQNNPTNFDLV